MKARVVQWGTGSTGTQALQQAIEHPDIELVGVLVFSADKEGIDAGVLAGGPPVGVLATRDRDAVVALGADCALHNPRSSLDFDALDSDVVAMLEAGTSVISVATGYLCPWAIDLDRARRLAAACEDGGAALLGTGLAHGVTDRLAVVLTGLCASVEEIRFTERYDRRGSPRPYAVFEAMGMGRPASEFTPESPRGALYFAKFTETAAAIAAGLGTSVRSITRDVRVGLATRDLDIAAGRVAAGTVAAVAWTLRAELASGPRFVLVGQRSVELDLPGWDATTGWTIEVDGDPSSRTDMRLGPTVAPGRTAGGDTATSEIRAAAAAQVRAIPEVLAAPPGILQPRSFAAWNADLRQPPRVWAPGVAER